MGRKCCTITVEDDTFASRILAKTPINFALLLAIYVLDPANSLFVVVNSAFLTIPSK